MTRHIETPPSQWLASHIHYAAHPQPLLAQCLRPMVHRLREEDLISGYFFINYWLEGPHVRLRSLPRDGVDPRSVTDVRDRYIEEFLRRRPALYRVNEEEFSEQSYDVLFRLEFNDEDRRRSVDDNGQMRLVANNTVVLREYQPELTRYGGPHGVRLSEAHFETASDICLELAHQGRLLDRMHLFGTALLLMQIIASVFLPDEENRAEFYREYEQHWRDSFVGTDYLSGQDMDPKIAQSLPTAIRSQQLAAEIEPSRSSGRLAARWKYHCLELAENVDVLARNGDLVFEDFRSPGTHVRAQPYDARVRLLFSYVHMMNNRMHVLISDEVYLTQLAHEALTSRGEGHDR